MTNWSILTVEITSASITSFLTALSTIGINLQEVRYLDDLRVQARISGSNYFRLHKLSNKCGATLQVTSRRGLYFWMLRWLERPVFLAGIVLWIFLILYLPTRVLFVRVDGNYTVDSLRITEAAEKCGIQFGASRRYVRSERVKNSLLSEIDALQWVGVNTYGCVAVISVKERHIPETYTQKNMVSSIVAARDGIISGMTVTSGNPICKIGQAVRRGQILVSGYTDCGLSIKADSADAEITALTNRRINAMTLSTGTKRTTLKEIKVRYSIQIGKNVVKLYNDSGISDMSCVKIYEQKWLTLPGAFELPVSLIKETLYLYNYEDVTLLDNVEFVWMKQSAESYVQSIMVAGRILRESTRCEPLENVYCLYGIYACEEVIGQVQIEEIGQYNGERSR